MAKCTAVKSPTITATVSGSHPEIITPAELPPIIVVFNVSFTTSLPFYSVALLSSTHIPSGLFHRVLSASKLLLIFLVNILYSIIS